MNQNEAAEHNQPPQPLPCRGCMADCPNRSSCAGKPWRSRAK